MINPETLLKRLRVNLRDDPLQNASRLSQLKLSKQIYNNRSIRNISKFIKDAEAILEKSKQGDDRRVVTEHQEKQTKGRYDENELIELSYQFQSVKSKYLVDLEYIKGFTTRREEQKSQPNISSMKNRLPGLQQLSKQMIKRRPTLMNHHSALPQLNRMKSLTLSSNKQSVNGKAKPSAVVSLLRLKNRVNYNMENPEVKISLKDAELTQALNSLIALVGTSQARNHNIPHQLIFHKIQQHYKLITQTSDQFNPRLNGEGTNNNMKSHIELPYCQFTNYKDCRKSIEQIFNMSLKAAHRICFNIYDRNNNGVIDEKDIIELFTIGEDYEAMQQDMEIIIKNYKLRDNTTSSTKINQSKNAKPISPKRFPRRMITLAEQSDFSIEKLNKIDVIEENPQSKDMESAKFHKQIFYTFKETKQQFFKRKTATNVRIALTWTDFQQAFKNTRPQIYYDLLDFLFGINSMEIYQKAFRAAYEQDKKSYRIIVYNNDGKSEMGSSVYAGNDSKDQKNHSEDSSQRRHMALKESERSRKNTKSIKIRKVIESEQVPVDELIGKVKSIEQFNTLKYF